MSYNNFKKYSQKNSIKFLQKQNIMITFAPSFSFMSDLIT